MADKSGKKKSITNDIFPLKLFIVVLFEKVEKNTCLVFRENGFEEKILTKKCQKSENEVRLPKDNQFIVAVWRIKGSGKLMYLNVTRGFD